MRVIVFSHESDLDGLYSAAIALIRYPQAMTVFLGYGAENFQKIGNFIHSAKYHSQESGLLIIADLGLNDELMGICQDIFSDAIRNGWKVIWVDHHPWSQRAIEEFNKLGELVHDPSGSKCAADLMYERFLPGNLLASSLASMAHTMDFFTKDQYLTPISELIRYYQTFQDFYERLSDLARKSAKGVLWDVEMQLDYEQYARLRDRARDEVFASMRIGHVSGFKVAYVQSSPYLQNSLFSEEVFGKTGADLAMFYSGKGKVSIRRRNDKISCREVAAGLSEGGGHDYAAGAKFNSDPSKTEQIIAELEAAIARAASAAEKP